MRVPSRRGKGGSEELCACVRCAEWFVHAQKNYIRVLGYAGEHSQATPPTRDPRTAIGYNSISHASAPASNERPLSPHLQVYQLPLTAVLSILHRMTGVVLSFGMILVVCWSSGEQGIQH